MVTSELPRDANTTLEELCKRAGIDSTDELRGAADRVTALLELGQLAKLASDAGSSPHPPIIPEYAHFTDSRERRARPTIGASSIASERHSWRNEDAQIVLETSEGMLAGGVFDGLGGHHGSERASAVAATVVLRELTARSRLHMTPGEASRLAVDILQTANQEISIDTTYIATTAALASIHIDPDSGERFATAAWAGDSRVYIIRDGAILYRTLDDGEMSDRSMLEQTFPDEPDARYKVQAFLESVENIENYPPHLRNIFLQRNFIANCLDGQDRLTIHTENVAVQAGDVILVSSDGVHDNLTNQEILAIISDDGNVEAITDAALRRSRNVMHDRHKPDDITAVMIEVPAAVEPTPAAPDTGGEVGESFYCFTCGASTPHWGSGAASGCMYCNHTLGNT